MGKENGKGKEYIDGKLIFKGDYLDGEKWSGKKYNWNKDWIIEFEYLNGIKTENVKKYSKHKKLIFEGELMNNKRWIGKEYDRKEN